MNNSNLIAITAAFLGIEYHLFKLNNSYAQIASKLDQATRNGLEELKFEILKELRLFMNRPDNNLNVEGNRKSQEILTAVQALRDNLNKNNIDLELVKNHLDVIKDYLFEKSSKS